MDILSNFKDCAVRYDNLFYQKNAFFAKFRQPRVVAIQPHEHRVINYRSLAQLNT